MRSQNIPVDEDSIAYIRHKGVVVPAGLTVLAVARARLPLGWQRAFEVAAAGVLPAKALPVVDGVDYDALLSATTSKGHMAVLSVLNKIEHDGGALAYRQARVLGTLIDAYGKSSAGDVKLRASTMTKMYDRLYVFCGSRAKYALIIQYVRPADQIVLIDRPTDRSHHYSHPGRPVGIGVEHIVQRATKVCLQM
jgi:hypothetical protein